MQSVLFLVSMDGSPHIFLSKKSKNRVFKFTLIALVIRLDIKREVI